MASTPDDKVQAEFHPITLQFVLLTGGIRLFAESKSIGMDFLAEDKSAAAFAQEICKRSFAVLPHTPNHYISLHVRKSLTTAPSINFPAQWNDFGSVVQMSFSKDMGDYTLITEIAYSDESGPYIEMGAHYSEEQMNMLANGAFYDHITIIKSLLP
jgi:hypothetical protein